MTSASIDIDPGEYTEGDDRYIRFAEEALNIRLADTQREILRAVANNQRVIVVSGNGVGKSYAVAVLILAFILTNLDSTILGTSGSYSQFKDTMWRPLRKIYKRVKRRSDVIPGQLYGGNPPRLEIDDDWYAKVVSPRDPGDLEGRHNEHVLVVMEEADKRYITPEHFESAESSITDVNDRMIAIANPPDNDADIVNNLMKPDSRWKKIQFSSFESHNVRIDAGVETGDGTPDDHITGLVDLPTVAEDFESWNDLAWPEAKEAYESEFGGEYPGVTRIIERVNNDEVPRERLIEVLKPGFEKARTFHETHTDVDTRWYRRRLGLVPPADATTYRPWELGDVVEAIDRRVKPTETASVLSLDVARQGGDSNALHGLYGDELRALKRWKGVDHNENERIVDQVAERNGKPPICVDASGEGSGLADRLNRKYDVVRFNAGERAMDEKQFYDRYTEGLYHLGTFLRDVGSIAGEEMNRLEDELSVAARTLEFEERFYASRNSEVIKASGKDAVAEALGRSPDMMDSAYQALWMREAGQSQRQRLVW